MLSVSYLKSINFFIALLFILPLFFGCANKVQESKNIDYSIKNSENGNVNCLYSSSDISVGIDNITLNYGVQCLKKNCDVYNFNGKKIARIYKEKKLQDMQLCETVGIMLKKYNKRFSYYYDKKKDKVFYKMHFSGAKLPKTIQLSSKKRKK